MDGDGGNNNITVAFPGRPNWGVWWFNGLGNFQLDIVGFLAVLGTLAHFPTYNIAASTGQSHWRTLCGHDMPTFTVRMVEVTKVHRYTAPTRIDTFLRGQPPRSKTYSPQMGPPLIKAKATGPLSFVTLLGFFISLVLFIASVVFGDGMSIIATILLSGLSTLIGISNKWSLKLPQRPKGGPIPRGDVVIRYPNGSYLIVRCDEDIARELYFAPEEIDYNLKNQTLYRLFSLLGTLMLMLGVIALANSKLQLQFAWAGAYIIINAVHWIAAALPQRLHWDLTCYKVEEHSLATGPKNRNFTEALWKAILLTKTTSWVKSNEAAPTTQVWNEWLHEAEEKANEYGSHVGRLTDPLWPGTNPAKGIIWDVPSEEDWEPKRVWDKLNGEHMAAENTATIHPTKAV